MVNVRDLEFVHQDRRVAKVLEHPGQPAVIEAFGQRQLPVDELAGAGKVAGKQRDVCQSAHPVFAN